MTVVRHLRDQGGMYARALGNVAYIMVSPTTPAEVCDKLMTTMEDVVSKGNKKAQEESCSQASAREEIA